VQTESKQSPFNFLLRTDARFGEDVVLAQLEVPETLTHYGVTSDDVPVLAEQTMLLAGALEMNPVPFGLTEVEDVLRQMV
jgi:alcohol dehydrogenase class IV